MSALNFKARFAGPVERREKRQSIREKNRFAVGGSIQLYTGMRTKSCRKLVAEDPICTRVSPIVITRDYTTVDGWRLAEGDLMQFAAADGFPSAAAFHEFFLTDRDRFDGFLIQWDWPHDPS